MSHGNSCHRPVLVRPFASDDLDGVALVHCAARSVAYRGILSDASLAAMRPEHLRDWWTRRLSTVSAPHAMLVATEPSGADVFGFIHVGHVAAGAGEVFAIHVHPSAQRRGVGTSLMNAGLAMLREWADPRVVLWVLEQNRVALSFYRSRGWSAIHGAQRDEIIAGERHREIAFETITYDEQDWR